MKYKADVSSWRLPGHRAVPAVERKLKLLSFSLSQRTSEWQAQGQLPRVDSHPQGEPSSQAPGA